MRDQRKRKDVQRTTFSNPTPFSSSYLHFYLLVVSFFVTPLTFSTGNRKRRKRSSRDNDKKSSWKILQFETSLHCCLYLTLRHLSSSWVFFLLFFPLDTSFDTSNVFLSARKRKEEEQESRFGFLFQESLTLRFLLLWLTSYVCLVSWFTSRESLPSWHEKSYPCSSSSLSSKAIDFLRCCITPFLWIVSHILRCYIIVVVCDPPSAWNHINCFRSSWMCYSLSMNLLLTLKSASFIWSRMKWRIKIKRRRQ